ncbi:MAG TPA: hypothetical protein VF435_00405 [Pyrinomonadaceae bacterium]
MQNSLDETIRSKRQLKYAVIVFAVAEFIVIAFVLGRYFVQK